MKTAIKPLYMAKSTMTIWESFFLDFPIFGKVAKKRRAVYRQLADRADMCNFSDEENPIIRETALEVASIIREHLGWPNTNFISDDPCELLLASSPSGLEDVCAIMALGKRYGIPPEKLDDVYSLSFGELINKIVDLTLGPNSIQEGELAK